MVPTSAERVANTPKLVFAVATAPLKLMIAFDTVSSYVSALPTAVFKADPALVNVVV